MVLAGKRGVRRVSAHMCAAVPAGAALTHTNKYSPRCRCPPPRGRTWGTPSRRSRGTRRRPRTCGHRRRQAECSGASATSPAAAGSPTSCKQPRSTPGAAPSSATGNRRPARRRGVQAHAACHPAAGTAASKHSLSSSRGHSSKKSHSHLRQVLVVLHLVLGDADALLEAALAGKQRQIGRRAEAVRSHAMGAGCTRPAGGSCHPPLRAPGLRRRREPAAYTAT